MNELNQNYKEDYSVFDLPRETPDKKLNYSENLIADNEIDVFVGDLANNQIIALLHGGYWYPEYNKDHLLPLARFLNKNGYSVLLPEYRRIQGTPEIYYNNIETFFKFIQNHEDYKEMQISVIGHSVGGNLSIISSLNPEIKIALQILLAPVTDLDLTEKLNLGDGAVRKFLGESSNLRKNFDPINLSVKNIPTVIIHGIEDTKVPFQSSENYIKYSMENFSVNIDFVPLKNIGHFEIINPKNELCFEKILEKLKIIKQVS